MSMVVGVIGLGEVGSRFAAGLAQEGNAEVWGYSPGVGLPRNCQRDAWLMSQGVHLANSPAALAQKAKILLSVVGCDAAYDTAQEYVPFLMRGKIYADLSSGVPQLKRRIASVISATGASFVDGAIMASPLERWQKTPVVVSGQAARKLQAQLNGCGMCLSYVGETVGQASCLKVLRSIFAKSLEALLLETYVAAEHYGILDDVADALRDMFAREPVAPMFERMVVTNVVHAERRAREIGAMADLLEAAGISCLMSRAAEKKLFWAVDSGEKAFFSERSPGDFREVVAYLTAYQQRTASSEHEHSNERWDKKG